MRTRRNSGVYTIIIIITINEFSLAKHRENTFAFGSSKKKKIKKRRLTPPSLLFCCCCYVSRDIFHLFKTLRYFGYTRARHAYTMAFI